MPGICHGPKENHHELVDDKVRTVEDTDAVQVRLIAKPGRAPQGDKHGRVSQRRCATGLHIESGTPISAQTPVSGKMKLITMCHVSSDP